MCLATDNFRCKWSVLLMIEMPTDWVFVLCLHTVNSGSKTFWQAVCSTMPLPQKDEGVKGLTGK